MLSTSLVDDPCCVTRREREGAKATNYHHFNANNTNLFSRIARYVIGATPVNAHLSCLGLGAVRNCETFV